ncbi:KICSTOR complex protein kaptin isoform X2 [Aethina tumida]|uniref:KICSTOR complex protein kaptin isoform X2 n=1 Tax=Aethina tumida TaxID=116153 RepID=UPI00096B4733|nr:KICSTOR complex protein kaptin isoform X2 [Aethina tumida]
MEQFTDAHYFHLPSQGNVFTLTDLNLANGSKKLLVASLKREIFCFEYTESSSGYLKPTIKEVSFTYIPSGAEIISIDAFNKSTYKNEFVIGITIIKNSNETDQLETFLNIYSEWEENDDFNIENIAQNCLNVSLGFIPYKLLHTYLITWKDNEIISKEFVFVLPGSDHQVHVYKENSADHEYKEIDRDLFPEFVKTPSPVIYVDIWYTEDFRERITTFSCECGYVKLTRICTITNKLIYNFSTKFNDFISCVSIYSDQNNLNKFSKVNNEMESSKTDEKPVLNLLVTNTILPAVIFRNVLKYGLSDYLTLPRHDRTSILTSCEIADINFDGQKEILIGSSSQEILLYKYIENKGWKLDELRKFASPILGVKYVDITGDGVKELIVFSMKGIHILQDILF